MAFIPKPPKRQTEKEERPLMPRQFRAPRPNAALFSAKSATEAPNMSGNPNSPMAGGGDFGRFVSLGEYLGQNQTQAGEMATKTGNAAQNAGKQAQAQVNRLETSFNKGLNAADKTRLGDKAAVMPGAKNISSANPTGYEAAQASANSASDQANNLLTTGGLQTAIGNSYNQTSQSIGEGLWDAAQAQQSGGGRYAQLAARFGNLGQALSDANSRSAAAYDSLQQRNADWTANEEARKKKAEDERLAAEAAARAVAAANKAAYDADQQRHDDTFGSTDSRPGYTQPDDEEDEEGSSDERYGNTFGGR